MGEVPAGELGAVVEVLPEELEQELELLPLPWSRPQHPQHPLPVLALSETATRATSLLRGVLVPLRPLLPSCP